MFKSHVAVFTLSITIISKFVYVNTRLELRLEGDDTYAYLADALGSSRFVLRNGTHDVTSVSYYALTYEPFGEAVASSGFDRLTFASEVRDSTGLVYLGARYYDPELGRFTALDPLIGSPSSPQTLDRYVYCANSPLIHTDPSGKFWHIVAGAFIGGVVGVAVGLLEHKSAEQIVIMACAGAVSGGISMATFGMSSVVGSIAVNVVTSAVEEFACQSADILMNKRSSLNFATIGFAGLSGAFGSRYGFIDDFLKAESKAFRKGVAVGMEASIYAPVDAMFSVASDAILDPETSAQSINPSGLSTRTRDLETLQTVIDLRMIEGMQHATRYLWEEAKRSQEYYQRSSTNHARMYRGV